MVRFLLLSLHAHTRTHTSTLCWFSSTFVIRSSNLFSSSVLNNQCWFSCPLLMCVCVCAYVWFSTRSALYFRPSVSGNDRILYACCLTRMPLLLASTSLSNDVWFIIALIYFFSFRKSIATSLSIRLVCFSSAMFFICCCFYTVSTIIGSDFQTSFNGIDNLCTFVCSFCLEIACACTSVNSQFYRLLPVFDSLLLFIFFFFLLCYWNAHAYQSLTRLCRSRIQLRFIGNAAAVAVVVCLVFHHLKSIHRETVLFYFFIANVCLSFHWISVDFHRIHSFAFGCVVRFVMFFFAFLFLFRTSFRWNSNFWSILSWFWRKSTHHIALCDWSIAPI